MVKIITHQDIMQLDIQPLQAYNWVKEQIANKDKSILKPKISLKFGETGFYNTMPAILPSENTFRTKVVNRYADRFPSLDSHILLYDLASGDLLALMDANYITTIRTGAVAAYSIQLLAKKDFEVIGFIGLGNTARATFKVLMALYPNQEFIVKLKRYKDQHKSFIEDFKAYADRVKYVYCDTYDEVVSGSDVIVSSVTYAEDNFCNDSCYEEGCLVVPIHTRGFKNCDLFFDKVFADDRGHVEDFQYFHQFRDFAELSDVVLDKHKGRETDRERILAYNIGIAIHDVYFAKQIYQLIKPNHFAVECELTPPQGKFWFK